MKKRTILLAAILAVSLMASAAFSQDATSLSDLYAPKRQGGLVFSIAETGTGLGGFIAWPLMTDFHLGLNLDAYFLRDENEITVYGYYGYVTLNKQNNVYLFDLLVTIKKRFFAEDIDDSFRPFLTAGVGPFYGMNFPEFSTDDQGIPRNDEYRWALGGFFGGGVDFNTSGNFFIGTRAQYRFIPFTKKLGERTDHSMFELRIDIGKRF